jgi:hypothetical protein
MPPSQPRSPPRRRCASALLLLRLLPSLVAGKFKALLPGSAAGQPLPPVAEPAGNDLVW